MNYTNAIYRSFDGGISPMNPDLSLDGDNKLGNYDQNLVYVLTPLAIRALKILLNDCLI